MPSLVLELKQGELMVLNGASIRFRSKATIELLEHARFLFGKQLMAAADAVTPARRIYFLLQSVHLDTGVDRGAALAQFREAVAAFQETVTAASTRLAVAAMLQAVAGEDSFTGLKLARRIIVDEDAARAACSGPGNAVA